MPRTRTLILLGGKIASGKDYVANILVKEYGFTRIAFADILKETVSKRYNIPLVDLHTQTGKSKMDSAGISNRQRLIDTAFELRTIDDNYFVKKALESIKAPGFYGDVVISDFRYPNEYSKLVQSLHNTNVVVWTVKLTRESEVVLDIPSETALESFKFDFTLPNESDYVQSWFKIFLKC